MKSILFLIPKMNGIQGRLNELWNEKLQNAVEKGRWNIITPSALLLAAIAEQENHEISVVDEKFGEVDSSKFFDIVCIYTVTPNVKRAYWYAEQFHQKGAWVVLGGVHSFYMSEEAQSHCDTLLLGEGEITFRRFLKDFSLGRAKKRYYQPPGSVSLDSSPLPLYSCLDHNAKRLIPIQTARGCPHNCSFCNVNGLYGRGFRSKSKEQIKRELWEIGKLKECKTIYITNDNILSTQEHFNTLVEVMEESPLFWYANVDISFGQRVANIIKAQKSGLKQVLIGLESIDKQNLYQLNDNHFKFRYIRKYREYIARIQESGIGVVGSFIVGQANDSEDTFRYLEEFIFDTNLYGANVTVFTPYPGTQLYISMERQKQIVTYDWDYYTIFQPVIKISHMTLQKLNKCYLELLSRIHSKEFIHRRVRYFAKTLKSDGKKI